MSEPPNMDARHGQGIQIGEGGQQYNTWTVMPRVSISWPLQIGRPPLRARAYQRRRTVARQIAEALSGGGPVVLSQAVAFGGGGVGKTQLAAEFFAQQRAQGIELLLWVNASSRGSIVAAYASALQLVEPDSERGGTTDQAAERFLGWLGATSRSWLVVLDDVTTPSDIRGLWPEGPVGRVLATTRRRDVMPGDTRLISVSVFTPDEAREYLSRRISEGSPDPVDPEALAQAGELAEDLGRLPVALAQAAAVIVNEAVSCAEYRRRFTDRSMALQQLFPVEAVADEYQHTVATTWSLAIELADQLDPVGLARPALQIAAMTDPNGAPETLWTSHPSLDFLTTQLHSDAPRPGTGSVGPAGPQKVTAAQARTALRNLHRLSLLSHEPGHGGFLVRVHALVQRAALESLEPAQRSKLARVAADALESIWPGVENDPEHSRLLLQNAASVASRNGVLWCPRGHGILFRAGQSLGELGLLKDAVAYWLDMAATAARQLGPEHPDTLASRHNLAYWTGEAGDAAGAARTLAELLTDQRRIMSDDHPDTLATRHNLADLHGAAGDPAGAVAELSELHGWCIRVFGDEHPDTLAVRHGLAYWTGEAGDAAGAARTLAELLTDQRRIMSDDHPDTLATRHGLGRWQGEGGDPESALATLGELLADRSRVLGDDHPDTLATRHNLARWRGAAGDPAGAADLFDELLADRMRVLGGDHPHTLATSYRLADCRGRAGDAAAAVRMLADLLPTQKRVLGHHHPHTLATQDALAYWRGIDGDPAEAARAFQDLLSGSVRLLGPNHLHTLATRHSLALWRGTAGDAAAAVRMLTDLLPTQKRVLGHHHPHTLATQDALAYLEERPDRSAANAGTGDGWQELLWAAGADRPHTLATRHHLSDWRSGRIRRLPSGLRTQPSGRSAGPQGV
ncbi:tetratricopeptide repeat protein [Streptomyces avermitilis]|uniref:tetratricopeptide repeat protein n=1 Tax=Streptomyces avermitilis TaxID=33903 RepID=UPI00371B555D